MLLKTNQNFFFPPNQNVWRVFILGALLKLYKPIHIHTHSDTRNHFTFHHPKNGVRYSVARDTYIIHKYNFRCVVLSCRCQNSIAVRLFFVAVVFHASRSSSTRTHSDVYMHVCVRVWIFLFLFAW